jgi:hypothetical protein
MDGFHRARARDPEKWEPVFGKDYAQKLSAAVSRASRWENIVDMAIG